MTEPLLIDRPRMIPRELARLSAERARAESSIEQAHRARVESAEKEFQQTQQAIKERYQADRARIEAEYQQTREALKGRFESAYNSGQTQYAEIRHKIASQHEANREKARKDYEESRWTIQTLFEADRTQAKEQFDRLQQLAEKAAEGIQEAATLGQQARELVENWGLRRIVAEARALPEAESAEEDTIPPLRKHIALAEKNLEQLRALFWPRLLKKGRLGLAFGLLWLAVLYPSTLLPLPRQFLGPVLASVTVFFFAGIVWSSIAWRVRYQVRRLYLPLARALASAAAIGRRCRDRADKGQQQVKAQLAQRKEKFETDLARLKDKYQKLLAEIEQRHETELKQATDRYPRALEEMKQRYDVQRLEIETKYPKLLAEIQARFDSDSRQAREKRERLVQQSQAQRLQEWQTAARNWHEGLRTVERWTRELEELSRRLFPPWTDPSWQNWQPVRQLPPAIRFGEFEVALEQIPDGLPQNDKLRGMGPSRFRLPAWVPFPRRASLLLRAVGPGRAAAVQAMQAIMMRFLTALPAGKVRFTIIDPVGLGENFAAFMHLADHDELLVTSRIWTEPAHIEQRLADLTEHMENVIQKYLRNEYQSIEQYNEAAGEVAEPFRVLVVANFPANFSQEAAQRLVSIAQSGASCGVYVLVSADTKQPMPHGFNLADLEQACTTLAWREGGFAWKDPDLGPFPLELEAPPDADFCTRILQVAGDLAKKAGKVEVSFDFLAPRPDELWTSDSRPGIHVPLGRAGATKRQYLQLGQGTSQHVLIAGKTGSGKSTLLHALITNLALHYSPEEVELYLVDFKKGVEFKTYATYQLPHARVVAIESEREFGLSVLQRLDAELRIRGEKFRARNVHDVAGYRNANGEPMPRILLIVDEFQEFFVEDDKIAQEAALLLDRLVRQGRAFGLHVLLGSQTLGGAFSLARSTIDQMAVRIALQCSEADAHLILSKENSAARLLTRPGEAIYNDSNGLVEGNDIFQVVWLPEERREKCLAQVRELARSRLRRPTPPAIVFEGNVPADIRRNPLLHRLLAAPDWPQTRAWHAWLGDAIAIKDPTAMVYRRPGGTHLMMIGQQEEPALAILTSALVSLAAQQRPADPVAAEGRSGCAPPDPPSPSLSVGDGPGGRAAQFYLLDGTPADAPRAGYLARLKDFLPHAVNVATWKELPAQAAELAAELERRQQQPGVEFPPIWWIIYGLQSFRELRKGDDDFGFSRRREGQAASPAQNFAAIVNDGAGLGIYLLIWCDTLNNVQRCLDRPMLRNFEAKVLFQMSANDSSTLIDSPAASKLGLHRALFATEERPQPEKFRPYGLPGDQWLAWVKERLGERKVPVPASEG